MGTVFKKSSHPGTQHKKDRDTESQSSPVQLYKRKRKALTPKSTQGTHTTQISISDSVSVPSQNQLDVFLANIESQPQTLNLQIETEPSTLSPSLEIDMIATSLPDPYLYL